MWSPAPAAREEDAEIVMEETDVVVVEEDEAVAAVGGNGAVISAVVVEAVAAVGMALGAEEAMGVGTVVDAAVVAGTPTSMSPTRTPFPASVARES